METLEHLNKIIILVVVVSRINTHINFFRHARVVVMVAVAILVVAVAAMLVIVVVVFSPCIDVVSLT